MLIITKNGQIIGIEKQLLNLLDADLSSLSDIVNTLNLQLSSVTGNIINIKNSSFNVKEIDFISSENIKAFELSTLQNESADTVLAEQEYISSDKEIYEPRILEDHLYAHQEAEKTPVFEKSDDFLVIPQEGAHEPQKEEIFGIDLIQASETPHNPVEEKHEEVEKLISLGEEKLEFEIPDEKEIQTDLNIPEEGVIEISFEDDLEEIRNILNMNKEEFNQAVIKELQKASEELGLDYSELLNWHDQLIEQIKEEKKDIYKFIEKKDYTNLHESYHKLKGAALNLRLTQIALVLKKLDELSKAHENIEKIKAITDDFYKLIENETARLSEQNSKLQHSETRPEAQNTERYVESIILKTIQTYLNTQNEAQFQKDKKYIEKLLNTKIDSIEDLEKIVKGM